VKALADNPQFLPAKGMKRRVVGVVEGGKAAFHYPKPHCEWLVKLKLTIVKIDKSSQNKRH
jgi:hypothetical protein